MKIGRVVVITLSVVVTLCVAVTIEQVVGTYRARQPERQAAAASFQALRLGILTRSLLREASPAHAESLVCALMDWEVSAVGLITIAAFDDGTTSLYSNFGFGVLGAGEKEPVRVAAHRFREAMQAALDQFHA